MHVGNFYLQRQPDSLLEALAELRDPNIEFVQVGGQFPALEKYKDRIALRHIPAVAHAEALELMKTASVLYLKQGFETGVKDYIAVAAKTYEYIATGLPIIADCPPGDNSELIAKYAAASYLVADESKDSLRGAIIAAKKNSPGFVPHIRDDFRERFSRESLTNKLANVFNCLA